MKKTEEVEEKYCMCHR